MARTAPQADRPAFYALASGGWRDLVTLLHPPYTAWHLGEQRLRDGRVIALDTRALAAPLDGALRACAIAVTLLAIALVVPRLH